MPESGLAATGISHIYGAGVASVRALDGVTTEFAPGRLHLVMGPSGSGKTTLLSVIGGLLTPDAGEVRLLGRAICSLPEVERAALRRRHIGFVFQAFRLFRALTALENVSTALDIAGRRGRDARVSAMAALQAVGIDREAHRRPHELSGGQKQRVAIARALVNEPQILLADEPTASLDSASGMEVTRILQHLAHERNRIVIAVSHDPRLVPFADRIVRLEDGRVVEDKIAGS